MARRQVRCLQPHEALIPMFIGIGVCFLDQVAQVGPTTWECVNTCKLPVRKNGPQGRRALFDVVLTGEHSCRLLEEIWTSEDVPKTTHKQSDIHCDIHREPLKPSGPRRQALVTGKTGSPSPVLEALRGVNL